ncbi:MAG: hypothetical protein MI923_05520 [Phycisphaerales bacterium]|nr:hypothetical protein [Phycisphaerales bacterium]
MDLRCPIISRDGYRAISRSWHNSLAKNDFRDATHESIARSVFFERGAEPPNREFSDSVVYNESLG